MPLLRWSVRERQTLDRYNVFEVVRGRYAREDGHEKTMMTLACPDWCNVVAVTAERQLVLVRQYRPGPDVETLETPGGVVDPGESPEETARRELFEETGYQAGKLTSLGWAYPNPALQANRIHFFVAEDVRRVGAPTFDGADEECDVVLIPLDEVDGGARPELFSHALCWAAVAQARRFLERRVP